MKKFLCTLLFVAFASIALAACETTPDLGGFAGSGTSSSSVASSSENSSSSSSSSSSDSLEETEQEDDEKAWTGFY
ncbi:MAG: hypothetical protein IJW60_02455 [Clostridia bacterium]|nr:hypothetical protein [Clostridia bacterium]